MIGLRIECLVLVGIVLASLTKQSLTYRLEDLPSLNQRLHNVPSEYEMPDNEDLKSLEIANDLISRDPSFLFEILSKMRARLPNTRPMEHSKRGIDFGLGRGFSGSQAAKHFMGMAAARYSGGPGKKKKRSSA